MGQPGGRRGPRWQRLKINYARGLLRAHGDTGAKARVLTWMIVGPGRPARALWINLDVRYP